MTVAETSALLYLPGHPRQQLLRALRIPALSPGWQGSFRALLVRELGGGNAGLINASPVRAWPGFRRLTVTAIERESDSVISIRLEDPDGAPLPPARPGQYLTLRLRPEKEQMSVLRNYSLSGPPGADYYRITVKREHKGSASGYLHTRLGSATNSTSQRPAAPPSSTRPTRPYSLLAELQPPRDAEAYLCGPTPFIDIEFAAATSPSLGATITRAFSNSPRRATYLSAGHAAQASATTAKPASSQAPSTTTQTP